ncbi:glycosyltransferase [Spirosoma linguale]|uniref:Glycosyl transferase, group 2 family protein n=1 Tax=Spirosoma linguale (strain ATCC 33905 / DSM 74 / LMG 10896 / Claus 1) TaxID=504472 RepID=D2QRK3_SPILD|nr:glycosyl transferase, group 2 family protein [Spirosoma linguale DSM 74]
MVVSNHIKGSDIAGVVILYNPHEQVFENIKTYLYQVSYLYVVDNSDNLTVNTNVSLKEISNIRYISNNGNKGVAYALNIASQTAIEDGYSYLLTMDDDSKAPSNMVMNMLNFLNSSSIYKKIAILSAVHSKCGHLHLSKSVLYTMTSGNLLNLEAYQKVGGFNDGLFIDHVDHEYNIRVRNAGFHIVELCSIKLQHRLGTLKSFTVFGKKIIYISHSPIRFYYFVRNGVYIVNKYSFSNPKSVLKIIWILQKEIGKVLFLEDEKPKRMNYFLRGVIAGLQGSLGKLVNE